MSGKKSSLASLLASKSLGVIFLKLHRKEVTPTFRSSLNKNPAIPDVETKAEISEHWDCKFWVPKESLWTNKKYFQWKHIRNENRNLADQVCFFLFTFCLLLKSGIAKIHQLYLCAFCLVPKAPSRQLALKLQWCLESRFCILHPMFSNRGLGCPWTLQFYCRGCTYSYKDWILPCHSHS